MSRNVARAELRRQGRMAEQADVIEQLRLSIAGAQGIAARHEKAGVDEDIDTMLYINRLDALIGTIEAGCHEGLAQ